MPPDLISDVAYFLRPAMRDDELTDSPRSDENVLALIETGEQQYSSWGFELRRPRAKTMTSKRLRSAAPRRSDRLGPPALNRAVCGQGDEQRRSRLLARSLIRLAALLDAFDEVTDLGPPRIDALELDRLRHRAG